MEAFSKGIRSGLRCALYTKPGLPNRFFKITARSYKTLPLAIPNQSFTGFRKKKKANKTQMKV